ncbi:MAG TPA: GIY-YIG nuclease family protein [Bacteroidota bacterium]|nr:GIY-YIG nuclease family protein [Bacteroidota bacterium]
MYILCSQKHSRSYVGQTNDCEARLERHNRGYVTSTRPYRPWVMIQREQFETRGEAMKREHWYKTGTGHRRIKKLIAEYLEAKRLLHPPKEGARKGL